MFEIVAYGLGQPKRAEEDAAMAWAGAGGHDVLLWRRDGRSAAGRGIEERPALHQALFLLRARVAQALWLPNWRVILPADHELLCAEVWDAGGRLVIGGHTVVWEADAPPEVRARREVALAGVRLRNEVDPRIEVRDEDFDLDADIGAYEGGFETARFAHKLREEFRLTFDEVAVVMNTDGYVTKTGKRYTAATVKHLVDDYRRDLRIHRTDEATAPGSAGFDGTMLVTFGADREAALPAARRYNEKLSKPYPHVLPFDVGSGARGGSGPGADNAPDPALADLLRLVGARLIGTVCVSSEEAFGHAAMREVAYAQLWRNGAAIVVDGEPVDPRAAVDPHTAVLRRAATSGALLHAKLRAHDSYTLTHDEVSLETARSIALRMRNPLVPGERRHTLNEIAEHLNREAFPTRKRSGEWSASAVRDLLPPALRGGI